MQLHVRTPTGRIRVQIVTESWNIRLLMLPCALPELNNGLKNGFADRRVSRYTAHVSGVSFIPHHVDARAEK